MWLPWRKPHAAADRTATDDSRLDAIQNVLKTRFARAEEHPSGMLTCTVCGGSSGEVSRNVKPTHKRDCFLLEIASIIFPEAEFYRED